MHMVNGECVGWINNYQQPVCLLFSGFQQVKILEGTAQIWIKVQYLDIWHYYLVGLYWASQMVGTLGMGDINCTFDEDLFYNFCALFIAVLCRCAIMCRFYSRLN